MLSSKPTRRQLAGLAGICVLGLPLSGCDWFKPKNTVTSVKIQQEWFAFSGFAGEVVAAQRFAGPLGLAMKVVSGSETIDPIKNVLAGQADIGVASADLVVSAIAGGAPLVIVGFANDRSPTCFLARKDSKISSIRDFAGRRVGILSGTNTERIYQLLMLRNRLDRSSVNEVNVPFDLNTFVLGEYDVRPAFVYDEPVTLARQHVDINIIRPEEYGVNFAGTAYFVRRDMTTNHPDTLVTALRSLILGWRSVTSAKGRADAIAMLKAQFPEIDQAREAESLERAVSYFLGPVGSDRPLDVTPSHLEDTIRGMEELKSIPAGKLKPDYVFNRGFLNDAYDKLPKLG